MRSFFILLIGLLAMTQAMAKEKNVELQTLVMRPKIAVQLHSVKQQLSEDFVGTLKTLADIGFQGVEFAGRYGDFKNDPEGLKQLLSELSLEVTGVHAGIKNLRGKQGHKNFAFYRALGASNVIIPHDARVNDPAKIDELIHELNEIEEVAHSYGLQLGYHNHSKEFEPFKDTTFWQYLAQKTSEKFIMQLDVGWAIYAGQDPLELIKNVHPNRVITSHYKIRSYKGKPSTVAADAQVILGSNGYNWDRLINTTTKYGATEWIIVEQEEYPQGMTPLEAVKASYQGLLNSTQFYNEKQQATKLHDRPNVIIIVADQMRRASMGFWREEKFKGALNGNSDYVITPNLDKLANEGAVFTQAIANYPLCSPFRGMLLSGRYPNNNGVTNNTRNDRPNIGLRTDITTITEVFADNNYNTALVGKGHWHNNLPMYNKNSEYVGTTLPPGGHFFRGTRYDTYIPPGEGRQGIEYWYQALGHNHKSPVVYTNDIQLSGKPEGHPYLPKRYSAVDQANVIIDYIENNREQRDNNKPFSLIWTMDPPHSPYTKMSDTDEHIYNKYYKDIAIETLLNRANVDLNRAEKSARIHFSMVTLIDREIGRMMAALKQQGIAENTLIVFTSDHGEMMGSQGLMTKNVFYEESLGIPLVIHLPNKIKPQINPTLFSVPDFMPTILALAGLEQYIPTDLDGTDFSQQILNPNAVPAQRRKSSLYYGKSSEFGVRTDKYTYVIDAQGELIGLFNNIADPYQLANLTLNDIPKEDVTLLKQELGDWLKHIDHDWYHLKKHPKMISYEY